MFKKTKTGYKPMRGGPLTANDKDAIHRAEIAVHNARMATANEREREMKARLARLAKLKAIEARKRALAKQRAYEKAKRLARKQARL